MTMLPARTGVSDTYPNPTNGVARAAFGTIWDVLNESYQAAEVSVVAAATIDIGGQTSMKLLVTGTASITSLGTNYRGPVVVRFSGTPTLTHNATTLLLPNGANISVVAGDVAIFSPKSASGTVNGWQCVSYVPSTAAGARANLGLGTAAVLNVGTSANSVVQLDSSGKLPAIDGSALTGISSGGGSSSNADIFTGNGTQTTFTLSANPGALNNLDVSISGITQKPGIDYIWASGTTITFTSAPPAGTNNVLIRYMQALALGTADASSVQYTPAGAGAVVSNVQEKLRSIVNFAGYTAQSYYDAARAALTGRSDLLVRPDSESTDILLSAALDQTRSALLKARTAPHANFNWFTSDFTVAGCPGTGQAVVVQDIADVFQTKFGALIGGTVSYVHPSGSDANTGSSWRSAFLTLSQALRSTTNGTIYIWPGTYDLSDFRYTDSYGDHPKKIIAPYGGVILRVAGDDPVAATWGLNGDYGGVYQMHVVSSNNPIRLLRKDLLDKYGEPTPMPYFSSLLSLASTNFGWAFDPAYSSAITGNTTNGSNVLSGVNNVKSAAVGMAITGPGIPGGTTITAVIPGTSITMSANATATATGITTTVTGRALYVRDAMSTNVNTTTKANIQLVYGAGGDNRTLLYSTTSYWENITFWGYISVLKVAGQAAPQFWAKKCSFKYGATHAILAEGGHSYTQECRAYRMSSDGANYNALNGTTAQGVEINFTTQFAGDVDTYGTSQTANPQGNGQNKNGSSNHDAYVVRVNGLHIDPFGPNIADTATSYSWNLGVQAGYSQLTVNGIPSIPRYGILNQGNNAWNDGCSVTGNDAGFNSDSGANVKMFNCFGTQAITNGGVFTTYIPS